MVKKLAAKTAGISMEGFKPRTGRVFDGQTLSQGTTGTPTTGSAQRPFTGVGTVIAAITREAEVTRDLDDARSRLAAFATATIERAVDPRSVVRSRWANRDAAEFSTASFLSLKAEIASAGRNVQAIKVRCLAPDSLTRVFDGQTPLFEIAYGHRRHQACLELGLPVHISIEQAMTDQELFQLMDRENRERKNLSAWEQGRMYSEALAGGLYPSLRRLADALGVNLSDASRSVQLAKLPAQVIAAFASPLDLQFRWSKALTDALQRDPDGVLNRAKRLAQEKGKRSPAAVFDSLVGKEEAAAAEPLEIASAGKRAAVITRARSGAHRVQFEPDVLSHEQVVELAAVISSFLEHQFR